MKRLSVDPAFLFFFACCLLLLPLKWVLGAGLAAAFHESCHLAAVQLTGGRVGQIRIYISGAVMDIGQLSNGQELICAAAGPMGSFFLILFAKWFPELAVCGWIQGIFNLIPACPLDGGRILTCLLTAIIPERAEKISAGVGAWISVLLAALFVFWGFLPGIPALLGCFRYNYGKLSCKEGKLAVQ